MKSFFRLLSMTILSSIICYLHGAVLPLSEDEVTNVHERRFQQHIALVLSDMEKIQSTNPQYAPSLIHDLEEDNAHTPCYADRVGISEDQIQPFMRTVDIFITGQYARLRLAS